MDEYLTFRLLMQRITCMLTRVVVSGPEAQSPRKSLPYKKSAPVFVECANVVHTPGLFRPKRASNTYSELLGRLKIAFKVTVTWYLALSNCDFDDQL